VHVGRVDLWLGGLPDAPDRCSFLDRRALRHRRRAEMCERNGVPVGSRDRDNEPAARHLAHERHLAAGRRVDGRAQVAADVDAPVLAAGVRVGAETEGAEHRSVDRPRPGPRYPGRCECSDDRQRRHETAHPARSFHICPRTRHRTPPFSKLTTSCSSIARVSAVVNCGYRDALYSALRGCPVSVATSSTARRRGNPAATSS